MLFETIHVGELQVNCYILGPDQTKRAIIIDPGADSKKIKDVLQKNGLVPAMVINTHGHFDHIGCDEDFGAPVYIHRDDAVLLRNPRLNLSALLTNAFTVSSPVKELEDKEIIKLDEIELEVIHTPGHTPGGICLLMKSPVNNILFTGDTLFCESVGRTDFEKADELALIHSIRGRLLVLPDETIIYPGHGPISEIGYEKQHNLFLQ